VNVAEESVHVNEGQQPRIESGQSHIYMAVRSQDHKTADAPGRRAVEGEPQIVHFDIALDVVVNGGNAKGQRQLVAALESFLSHERQEGRPSGGFATGTTSGR
jgi:hypothetical protein